MRVLILWLKYLFFGMFLAVAAFGNADVHGFEEGKETRFRTQVVSALGGPLLLALALGFYMRGHESADQDAARMLVLGAGSLFALIAVISLLMIRADLRRAT